MEQVNKRKGNRFILLSTYNVYKYTEYDSKYCYKKFKVC